MSEQYPESSPGVDSILSRLLAELKDGVKYNTATVPSADFNGGFQWPSFDLTVSLSANDLYYLERLSSLYLIQKNRLASWLLSELLGQLHDSSEHPLFSGIPGSDVESDYVQALYQIGLWSRWRDSMRDSWRSLDASNRNRNYVDGLSFETDEEAKDAPVE